MQVETKNYCMVVRAEGRGAILTTSKIANVVIGESFTKTLPKQL